jgi:hypothetical protein
MRERGLVRDRTYQLVMASFVTTGRAPHYADIARELSVPPEEGKRLLHDLMDATRMPMWLHPGTDLIASFAPFSNIPTQYRLTIDGHQRWFAQ